MAEYVKYHESWLSLGGNIGDVKQHFRYALQKITDHAECHLLAVSSLYQTPAWGYKNQADFLNACAHLETALTPQALLQFCLQTEKECGRQRQEKWGSRSLDMDILFYGAYKCTGEGDNKLTLPHPHIAERAFVVIPLAEISPDLLLNGVNFRKRAAEMKKYGKTAGIKKIAKASEWHNLHK